MDRRGSVKHKRKKLKKGAEKFHRQVDQLANKVTVYLNVHWPTLYKLLVRCPSNDLWVTRKILALPIGYCMGLLFHYAIIKRLLLGESAEAKYRQVMVTLITLAYSFSVQMRVISWLIVPTLVGRMGRNIVVAILLTLMISKPVGNFISNTEQSVKSLSCLANKVFDEVRQRYNVVKDPMTNIINGVKEISPTVNRVAKELKEDLTEASLEILGLQNLLGGYFLNPTDTPKNLTEDLELEKEKLKKNESMIPRFNNASEVTEFFNEQSQTMCSHSTNNQFDVCGNRANSIKSQCNGNVGAKITGSCYSPELSTEQTCPTHNKTNLLEQCNEKDKQMSMFGKIYYKVQNLRDTLTGNMSNITAEIVPIDISGLPNPEEVIDAFKETIWFGKKLAGFITDLFNHLLTVFFLVVLLQAYNYHKSYITNIKFDNIYITRYFRRIEDRRREKDEMLLLPLKKLESSRYVWLLNAKLSAKEKDKALMTGGILIVVLLFIALICYIDFLLSSFLESIEKYFKIEFTDGGFIFNEPKIGGSGFLAENLRNILAPLNINVTFKKKKFSTLECNPQPENVVDFYYQVFVLYILLVFLIFAEMYSLRLQHAVCGYFYRRRAKKRTLWLYNNMLKERFSFLKYKYDYLSKRAEKGKLDYSYRRQQALAQSAGLVPPQLMIALTGPLMVDKCIICDEHREQGGEFVECTIRSCQLLYCENCWKFCQKECLNHKLSQSKQEDTSNKA